MATLVAGRSGCVVIALFATTPAASASIQATCGNWVCGAAPYFIVALVAALLLSVVYAAGRTAEARFSRSERWHDQSLASERLRHERDLGVERLKHERARADDAVAAAAALQERLDAAYSLLTMLAARASRRTERRSCGRGGRDRAVNNDPEKGEDVET